MEILTCFSCERTNETDLSQEWYIGLDASGQAHYSCIYCSPMLFNVLPVSDVWLNDLLSGGA